MIYNLKQCLAEFLVMPGYLQSTLAQFRCGNLELRQVDTTVNLLRNDFVRFALKIGFYFYYIVLFIIITSLNTLYLINSREGYDAYTLNVLISNCTFQVVKHL